MKILKHEWPHMDKIQTKEGIISLEDLEQRIEETVYEHGKGLPIPAIMGVLDLVKRKIVKEAEEE